MQKRRLPKKLNSVTVKETVGCGSLYVTINKDGRGHIRQVTAHLGKTGDCARVMLEAICRMINFSLDYDLPPSGIERQLEGIRCGEQGANEQHILSCPDCISKKMKEENAKTTSPDRRNG